jgi:hypothetical protein
MRSIQTALGLVVLASCAGGNLPNTFTGPASGGTALNCITDRLGSMGYHSVGGGPSAGAVRMERMNDEFFWLNMIGINDSVDVLDASTQGSQLRVNAYSQMLRGDERQSAPPSDTARREARDAFEACT